MHALVKKNMQNVSKIELAMNYFFQDLLLKFGTVLNCYCIFKGGSMFFRCQQIDRS